MRVLPIALVGAAVVGGVWYAARRSMPSSSPAPAFPPPSSPEVIDLETAAEAAGVAIPWWISSPDDVRIYAEQQFRRQLGIRANARPTATCAGSRCE